MDYVHQWRLGGFLYGRVAEPLLWRLRACLICRTGHRPFAIVWRRDCFRAGWLRRLSSCGFSSALWLGLLAFCWKSIREENEEGEEVIESSWIWAERKIDRCWKAE